MKNKVVVGIIVVISLITLLCGCSNDSTSDAIKFKNEYEDLNGQVLDDSIQETRTITIDEDNPIVYKDASDIIEMIEDGETFAVYFGFSSCPWCRSVVPTLIQVANDLGLDTLYYVDVLDIRDTLELNENDEVIQTQKGTDDYYTLLALLDNVLEDYDLYDSNNNTISTSEKRIYAPSVVAVVDGKAKVLETGISDDQTDAYMDLTDEMLEETYNKFKCVLQCITEANNSCSTNKKC